MSDYYKKLHKAVQKGGFSRVFYGKCPKCDKNIFSIGEVYDEDYNRIRAKFICPCGYKFMETMIHFKQNKHSGYKYPQGLVETMRINGKDRRIIRVKNRIYLVTPEKIMSKEVKKDVK